MDQPMRIAANAPACPISVFGAGFPAMILLFSPTVVRLSWRLLSNIFCD
jgi:hypothetical protein